eukprot:COSAG02_NODE_4075_length_5828_cov_9.864200_1_plen_64_part_00
MLIYGVIREKKLRFEVIRGCTVFISEFSVLHTIPTQPGQREVLVPILLTGAKKRTFVVLVPYY